jgi:hypothetical protein
LAHVPLDENAHDHPQEAQRWGSGGLRALIVRRAAANPKGPAGNRRGLFSLAESAAGAGSERAWELMWPAGWAPPAKSAVFVREKQAGWAIGRFV